MQFDKRAWLDKIKQMFAGFDRPLALIVFLLCQDQIYSGMAAGAVKE